MPSASVRITDLYLEENGLMSGRITLPENLKPESGQYLLASSADAYEPAPLALFASGAWLEDRLPVAPPLPPAWAVGSELSVRGPLGKGFQMPGSARRVALAAPAGPAHSLLPLLNLAVARGADVVLYTDEPIPQNLALAVEVSPLNQLAQAPTWADYLALELPADRLPQVDSLLGLDQIPGGRCPCLAEVLVRTPMPCGGVAECGVCGVHSGGGWRLACKDGPVFALNSLQG
jgi:dihydroorotate dehydrogenase electron transfer subunit